MPTLESYQHDEFPSHLHWQAVSFMRIEWPSIEGGLLSETYPASAQPTHFALVEGRVLISYAGVVRLDIEHAGETYRLAGLGNVLTYPGFRRGGNGTRVVEAATRHIDRSDADVAALFCAPPLESFYARHGWRAIRDTQTLIGTSGAPRVHEELRMMRFASPKGREGRRAFETRPLLIAEAWCWGW